MTSVISIFRVLSGSALAVPRRHENMTVGASSRARGTWAGRVTPSYNGNVAAVRRRAAIHARVGINPGIIYWRDLQSTDRRSVSSSGSPRRTATPTRALYPRDAGRGCQTRGCLRPAGEPGQAPATDLAGRFFPPPWGRPGGGRLSGLRNASPPPPLNEEPKIRPRTRLGPSFAVPALLKSLWLIFI